jgi:DNA polymerase III subunit delta'
LNLLREDISFGDRRLVGQEKPRNQIERILQSGRLSHSYLFTGPDGSGKMAFALAMAEAVNGVDHLTDLKGTAVSKKSSWYTHPDIHLFIPLPSSAGDNELKTRLDLLAKDPYEIVDFTMRPTLADPESGKNLRAFYSIEYFHSEIRPRTVYKPNEGRRTIVIISGIDTMRKESANAFLKLLEEPAGNVLFLLTASKPDQLLPTIISRCQQIRLHPLSNEEVAGGLVQFDGISMNDASFLARLSGGNYSLSRFFDVENLQQTRQEIINFLRYSYSQDVPALLEVIKDWNSRLNKESQIALCNTLEQFLRDLVVYRETENIELIANADQIDVIRKFCDSMEQARIEDMILHLQNIKGSLYQNVQFKYIFSVLSLRYYKLMRGEDPVIETTENWKHLPAYTEY